MIEMFDNFLKKLFRTNACIFVLFILLLCCKTYNDETHRTPPRSTESRDLVV